MRAHSIVCLHSFDHPLSLPDISPSCSVLLLLCLLRLTLSSASNLPILGTLSDLEVDQLTIIVRSPAQFTIIARNALGLPSSLPTNFSVYSDRNLTFPFKVVNNMDSTHTVSFTPDQPYSNLFIFVQNAYGVPVVGSPLIFNGISTSFFFLSLSLFSLLFILHIVQSGIENPCTVKNGRCDYRVSCNFTNGDIVCGPCPPGTHGQAAFGCNRMSPLTLSRLPPLLPLSLFPL